MEKRSVIGRRIANVDAWGKATGKAAYGIDVKFPGMLEGKILRSSLPHARILRIDTSQAKKLRGVRAVITAEDTPKILYGAQIADEFPLAVDKVRYIGDEVAAVAAVDQETALEALARIRVEYEELPAVFSPRESLQPGAPQIHAAAVQNRATHIEFERGDVREGLQEADIVIEEEFQTSNVHPLYLEPHVCVVRPEGSGSVSLWGSLQAPARNRETIARALNLPIEKVRIIQTVVGGGFGGKATQVLSLYPICVLLALKSGMPVRILNTWEEEFASSRSRMPAEIGIKLGIRKNGLFTAKEIRILANCGAYAGTAPAVVSTTATRATSLYRLRNVKCRADLVYTNQTPVGSYRGYGNPQLHFALESAIDMAAEKIGMDPAEVRLKNAIQVGETSAHGWVMNSCALKECLEVAVQKSGWKEKRSQKREPYVGVGMSSAIHVSGNRAVYPFFDGSAAYVRINSHGGIDLLSGEAEIGQGSNTVFAQIVAETFGLPVQDIRIVPLDTDHSPYALGTFASRVSTLGGNAVLLAAHDARRQLLEFAAAKMETAPENLQCSGGRIFVGGAPDQGMNLKEAARLFSHSRGGASILGTGNFVVPSHVTSPDPSKYGNISMAYSFAVQFAEVKVDPGSGKLEILRFLSVHDSGTILNPLLAEGQVEGGVVQGMGYGLLEEIVRTQGRVMNDNFTDYRIPTISDVPSIESVFIEIPDPFGPFGAKGLGEITQVGVAPAIANAIYDAAGIRLKELPMTSERIFQLLQEKDQRSGKARPISPNPGL